SAAIMTRAWQQVAGIAVTPAAARGGLELAGPSGTGIFRGIVDQKISSYEVYNAVPGDAEGLFLANVRHYFARYPIPEEDEPRARLQAEISGQLGRFVAELLSASEDAARRAGHALIRPEDVAQELQRLTPHEVSVFEDALFFPRLPPGSQQTIESYDMDSFRDLGLHWRVIRRALEDGMRLRPEPDPFAAEALAEGIAQYGVLLLRLSGELARQQEAASLEPAHLRQAAERIRVQAHLNEKAVAAVRADPRLVSSSGSRDPDHGSFFTDITAQVGLSFHHRSADWLNRLRRSREVSPPTFSGGGVAAEDVDGDGFTDLLLLGGSGVALLRNTRGEGGERHFEDVTEAAGIRVIGRDGLPAEARQPLIVDLDNDGKQDIIIILVNENHRVYRNLGGMRFQDVSDVAGLGGQGLIAGPATAADFDGDGLLDLYIGNFGDYLAGELPRLARDNRNGQPNQLFRNLGDMRFEEVSRGSVLADTGWAQAVSHTDYDGDGRQDIIVANDYGRNAVLHNLGGGRFEDRAAQLGMDDSAHSMNVGIADLNADEHPDFYISNIVSLVKDDRYVLPNPNTQQQFRPESLARMRVVESNKLYISTREGEELKYVVSSAITRGSHSTGWAWDADFFDFDNDGDDDLYCVNGANDYFIFGETRYIMRGDGLMSFPYTYGRESNVFFLNQGNELQDASERSGADFVGTSRSSAYLDFDRDGDLDVVVNNFHQPAVFLRNNSETLGHHWLRIRLVGDPSQGSNRDAIGARLLVRTPAGVQIWREVHGGTGYLSMDPKEVHIGLGTERRTEVRITWPNGQTQILRDLEPDRTHRILQK
ncbi:MAG: CRTAC1 family protein, partial [Acidobacteria bacterium]